MGGLASRAQKEAKFEGEPWQQARVASVEGQKLSDAWRKNGPETSWGLRAQFPGQPSHEVWANDGHTTVMDRANAAEALRVAAVAETKAENEWRKNGPATSWGLRAQLGEDPWYQKDFEAGHKVVMERANADEAERVANVNGQAKSDVWRGKGSQEAWGVKNPEGWSDSQSRCSKSPSCSSCCTSCPSRSS